MRRWKVGELARRTGLTVRTLHHYDRIGLLSPSGRTAAGYRLYSEADVERLQRIVSLRALGLSLEEIRRTLDAAPLSLRRTLELHLERLRARMAALQALHDRLSAVAERVREPAGASAEELIDTIGAITMFEKYYSPEQMQQLEKRRQEVGEERIREVEAEWPTLIAEVRAEVEKGADPTGERGRELARRWNALVREFTGGDPGIARSLERMYREDPSAREWAGLDPAVQEFVARASAADRA